MIHDRHVYIKSHYAEMTNKELAKVLSVTVDQVKALARRFGLRKKPEQISKCHRVPQYREKNYPKSAFSPIPSGGYVCVRGNVLVHKMQLGAE